ncbi:SDR family oxidoreductase [Candidatus Pelagibacter sp.]|nr:SDR family oxidoreductase [Candidatus Pelagibacter sp.]
MKKILILGSAGQIGLHLKEYLGEKNYKVFNFDIVNGKSNDLRKKNNLKLIKLLKKTDYVFFLAFDVGGSRYLKKYQNSKNFIMNNMMIMSNTFDLLSKYKKPFLFASSQMSNMLYSNYGLLKLIGERITSTLNGNFVKLWNVYGIENDIKKSHVITDFVLKAIKFKKIQMLTNGKESREFLYADDCCEALEIIMKKHNFFKNQKNELHLTNGIKTRIVDIAKIIKKNLSKKNLKIKIISGKSKDNVQLNKNNKNNNFLKKYWKPKVSISAGINKIISHYLED